MKYVKLLKIPYFRGVFMRDSLPKSVRWYETGIINMDREAGEGTHWTSYVKHGHNILYFDSVGALKPPPELVRYFRSDGSKHIRYNITRYQKLDSYNCGHLVLRFLNRYARQKPISSA